MTVNLSYTWAQKRQRCIGMLDEVLERFSAPLHLLPERMVERKETQKVVQQAIESLPLPHRVVVVLFYLEGFSLKEIADVLEIPEGTVKSRLYYARESLKELLTEKRAVSGVAYEFT